MALVESSMMELNRDAPDFTLPEVDGQTKSLGDYESAEVLVVMFICNHCPYVVHIADVLKQLAELYQKKGVAFVAINSNDAMAYPADSFEAMKEEKHQRGYTFDYLFDESQLVAKKYDAVCTPDFFVFDKERKLAYRGEFDKTRPTRISSGNYNSNASPASGESLAAALDCILRGDTPAAKQYPSMGCSIKWRD